MLLEKIANEYTRRNLSVVMLESRSDLRKVDESLLRSYAIGMTDLAWKGCESSVGLKEYLQKTVCSLITKVTHRKWNLVSSTPSKRYMTTQVNYLL